jgi:hypothetical protein
LQLLLPSRTTILKVLLNDPEVALSAVNAKRERSYKYATSRTLSIPVNRNDARPLDVDCTVWPVRSFVDNPVNKLLRKLASQVPFYL